MALSTNENDMPLLVFSTPRTGSTLFFNILASYFKKTRGTEGLGEYFNLCEHSFWDGGSEIIQKKFPTPVPIVKDCAEIREAILEKRIQLLKKYHGRYAIKLIASQVEFSQILPLWDTYQWIFVERRDVFDQFLSFAISMLTNVWYVPGGIRLEREVLEVRDGLFHSFERLYRTYLVFKTKRRQKKVIQYEDFLATPTIEAVLAKVGLKGNVGPLDADIPERQNPGDKLRYFKNPEKIFRLYRNSFLNQISPLGRSRTTGSLLDFRAF